MSVDEGAIAENELRKTGGGGGRLGLVLGPTLAALLLALGPPQGLSPEAWIVIALLALMVVWWISEAVPIAATALLPIFMLPTFDVTSAQNAAAPYADPVIFLFIGGFMLQPEQPHGRAARRAPCASCWRRSAGPAQ